MLKFWVIIISQVLAALIVFFTTDNLFNKKKKGQIFQPKSNFPLTQKGLFLLFTFLMIIGLSIWQEIDDIKERKAAENEITKKDSASSKIQEKRDSLAHARLIQSKNETIEALAAYGLKYDTAQKRIEKLVRDSSRLTIIKGAEPLVKFCAADPISFSKVNDLDSIEIKVCNDGAVSRNITIRLFLFVVKKDSLDIYKSLEYLYELKAFITPFSMGPSEWRSANTKLKKEVENFHLFLLATGSYTNSDGSKTFLIDDAAFFDFKKNKHFIPGDGGTKLKELLKSKGITI